MIKKLRVKFITISMVIFGFMLLVIIGLVHHFTVASMKEQSLAAMRGFAQEFRDERPDENGPTEFPPDRDDKPGKPGKFPDEDGKPPKGEPSHRKEPVFMLWLTPEGVLEASGSDFYDLEDEEYIQSVYEDAQARQTETGILYAHTLRYLRQDGRYYFVDITTQLETSANLLIICLVIGAAAMVIFFLVTLRLSRWMVKPIEEAWDQQRQFVADASHELKTPLTVILTNAELLRSPDYDIPAKDRFADSILSMSRQMRGLVESLLDLARVDGGNMRAQMEPLDFSQLTEDAVLPFEPVYFEAGRELCSQVEPGIRVNGSENYLRQVVEVLLDNGCKYGAAGQSVSLTLRRQGRGHCLLRVVSQGETLSPQQCRDIFKRFYRVDEARAMRRSYGLGLPIAMGIVTEHRGRIWAESKNGVNTFCVILPTI